MILRSLAIQGFRSFQKDQIIHFGTNPIGFYLIRGENGAGKSSIWDAVCWALYGVTARGSRAKAVSNWGGNHLTSVCLEFDANGQEYAVTRIWNPNSLTLVTNRSEPRTVTQKELEEVIGFGIETFLNVVLMGQFNPYFFDLGSAEKLKVFSDSLDLDYWVGRAKIAGKRATEAASEVSKVEIEVARLETTEQTLTEQHAEAVASMNVWHAGQQELAERLHTEILQHNNNLVELRKSAAAYAALAEQYKATVAEWHTYATGLAKQADSFNEAIGEHRGQHRSLKSQADALRAQQRESETAGVCRTCGQPLPVSGSQRQRPNAAADIEAIEAAMEAARLAADQLSSQRMTAGIKASDAQRTLAEQQTAYNGQVKYHLATLADVTRCEGRLEAANGTLATLAKATNPHESRAHDLMGKLAATTQSKQEKVNFLGSLRFSADALSYWAKKFKEIRLWLIEEALRELEIEANNCLIQLGLKGWRVVLDVERENATGGVTTGFSVLIYPPGFDTPVAWRDWSGGETQRLRIAGNVGLAELIRSRKGLTSNVEVWDEPTMFLNDAGIADLLAFFEARSREQQRQIWWMDHRSLNAGVFDGEVHVTKDDGGSHINDLR